MIQKIMSFLKECLAPKMCIGCKKDGAFLCEECLARTHEFEEICYVCKKKSPHFHIHRLCREKTNIHSLDKIIILTHYSSYIVANLIKKSKYYGQKDILDDFAHYLGKKLALHEDVSDKEEYLIIVPPMYFFKKWKRSYNHSEILAKNISRRTDIPYSFSVMRKKEYTPQQSKLTRRDRLCNLFDSFEIIGKNISKIKGKKVIVVDDVISTGCTLEEIGKLLKENGAIKVIGLVIASD